MLPNPNPPIFLAQSIHSSTVVENRPQRAQNCESQERTNIQGIENRRDYVAKEIQIGITEVPNRRKGLAVPRNIGEPTEQNPNHQNPTVDIEPFRESGGNHRQRRVQVAARAVSESREEEGSGGGTDGGFELGSEFQ